MSDSDSQDPQYVRAVLTEWARWLAHQGGHSRRSAIALFQDGGAGGVFCSKPPCGAMPGKVAERASLAMMRLRDVDPKAAAALEAWYLREGNPTAAALADKAGVGVGQFQAMRKSAEKKFGDVFGGLG
jgi:hypothetical protein